MRKARKLTLIVTGALIVCAAMLLASCDLITITLNRGDSTSAAPGTAAGAPAVTPADSSSEDPDPEGAPLDAAQIISLLGGEWVRNEVATVEYFRARGEAGGKVAVFFGDRTVERSERELTVVKMTESTATPGRYALVLGDRLDGTGEHAFTLAFSGGGRTLDVDDGEGEVRRFTQLTPGYGTVDPASFAKDRKGAWSASDGDFINFSDEKPVIMFGVWNSGGDFPVAEIKEVRKYSEDHYELTLMSDGDDRGREYVLEFTVSGGGMKFGAIGTPGKDYIFDIDRQFPEPVSSSEFMGYVRGIWFGNSDTDDYIVFRMGEGQTIPTLFFGNRRSEGDMGAYAVTECSGNRRGTHFVITLGRPENLGDLRTVEADLTGAGRYFTVDLQDGRGEKTYEFYGGEEIIQATPETYSRLHPGTYAVRSLTQSYAFLHFYGKDGVTYMIRSTGIELKTYRIITSYTIMGGERDRETKLVMRSAETGQPEFAYMRYKDDFKTIEFWTGAEAHTYYYYDPDRPYPPDLQ